MSDNQDLANVLSIREKGISHCELLRRYDHFAETYDKEVSALNYDGPLVAAQTLAGYFTDSPAKVNILDVAAGTGLVGDELKKLGFENVDALDPSPGMLQKAKDKNAHRNYICTSFTREKLDIQDNTYDGISLVGGFHHGHVPCEAVYEMIRLVKPGGLIVIVTRPSIFCEEGENRENFHQLCSDLEKQGLWTKHKVTTFPHYQDNEEGIIISYVVN